MTAEPPVKPLSLSHVLDELARIAPLALAEDWDNVGLLSGDPGLPIERVMTCLTVCKDTVDEAIASGVNLIVSHHPCPFRPINKIVTTTPVGRWLWTLTRAGIAVYSPHTAWDNARQGINARLAEILELKNVVPMRPTKLLGEPFIGLGVGRVGNLSVSSTIGKISEHCRKALPFASVACSEARDKPCKRIAIICGSGGSFVEMAAECGADVLLTGEATYHQYLEAQAHGLALLTIGHFASEQFAMKHLAAMLKQAFPTLDVRASECETDSFTAS